MKSILKTFFKLAFAAALIVWLIKSGRLNFDVLDIFFTRPEVLVMNIAIWLFAYLLLGSFRWYLLLIGLGVKLKYLQTVRLQLIGFFFNTVMPGAVSGDIIKAVYIIRDQKESGKTRTMLTILLDRVIGLAGLFVMAGMALLFTTKEVWDNPSLAKIAIFIAIAILGLVAGVALIFFPFKEGRDPFIKIFSIKLPGVSILRQIYEAMRSLSAQPKILCYTLAISILIHCCALLFAYYITEVLLHETVALPTFAVIFPVGLITTAIPLAPGGLGIGHVAFDRLYHLVGLHGGANVFNVMVLGQLSLHLLGVIPYLMYRRTDLKEPTT